MKKSFKELIVEAKAKKADELEKAKKEQVPVEDKPKVEPEVDSVKIDPNKLAITIVAKKEPKGKLNLKVSKNEYTFSENEVEALNKILDGVFCGKFTSETAVVNAFRAERKYIYIPESSKSVVLCISKGNGKCEGFFSAFKNIDQDNNMRTGEDRGMDMPSEVPLGINATFSVSCEELKDCECLTKKLNVAFAEFYEATEWCKTDDVSFQDWLNGKTANDEVNLGEKQKKRGKLLIESSFGDNLAETVKAVYSKLPLEEAKDFYLDLQKIIAKYSFVNREEMTTPVEDTPTLDANVEDEEGGDNVEVSKDAL